MSQLSEEQVVNALKLLLHERGVTGKLTAAVQAAAASALLEGASTPPVPDATTTLVNALVLDYLKGAALDSSASVFSAETGLRALPSRDAIRTALAIPNAEPSVPLLHSIVAALLARSA